MLNEAKQQEQGELWIDVQLEAANDNQPLDEKYPGAAVYHQKNPKVYELIKQFTFQVITAGFDKYSMYSIVNRVRWHSEVETYGDQFKINNNHMPYYARMFMLEYPEYQGFFETRRYPMGVKRG